MPDEASNSDLVEVVKRNWDFRRNYGTLIGGSALVDYMREEKGTSYSRNIARAYAGSPDTEGNAPDSSVVA
jgi:hypothetical protein